MKRSTYTHEQILAIVKEGEAGRKVADLCRSHGISEQTYYRWKAKYGGMELSELQRLKQLEDENRRLKHIVSWTTGPSLPAVRSMPGRTRAASSSVSFGPASRSRTRTSKLQREVSG